MALFALEIVALEVLVLGMLAPALLAEIEVDILPLEIAGIGAGIPLLILLAFVVESAERVVLVLVVN